MNEEYVTVTLRIPLSLRDWIKRQADKDRRSSHSLILRLLEKAMEASECSKLTA